ncbi:KilA-N domain-containing protein [Chromobacterium violaceum]|uniref:KilA-N domain-containing protein n=1 Tax=Chromobacterium violaceum TaxID=536 RepID=UPI0020CA9EA7|nr:KilA-N domain-containing protein [Chromobacterium violaceum]
MPERSAQGRRRRSKAQVTFFMMNKGTEDLVRELDGEQLGIPSISAKRGVGTYVVKELVYAYAMWISPKFHLEVIRAYDRLATDGVAVHKNAVDDLLTNPLKYLEALMGQAKALQAEKEQLEAKVEEDAPKVEAFEEFIDSNGLCNKGQAANALGLKSPQALTKILKAYGFFKDLPGNSLLTVKGQKSGHFKIRQMPIRNSVRTIPTVMIKVSSLPALKEIVDDFEPLKL